MKKNKGEIITLQIGSKIVQMETCDSAEVAKANACIQKKFKGINSKVRLQQARARQRIKTIILNV